MKTSRFNLLFKTTFFSSLLLLPLISCSKKEETQIPEPVVEIKKTNHNWYCFNAGKIQQIEKPLASPFMPEKPYTEAVRISCSSTALETDGMTAKAYSVLNQNGIICFEDDKFTLHKDSIFTGRTASNLVFYNNTPVFSLYKNTFFNNLQTKTTDSPFLAMMNPDSGVFYEILNISNITDSKTTQVTDFVWDGKVFSCCLKDSNQTQIDFNYLSIQTKEPLTSITPASAKGKIYINNNSQSDFRNAKIQRDFSNAPDRLKQLLKSVPENISFEVSLYTTGGHSPRTYLKNGKNSQTPLSVQAILSETWAAALFPDGTMYLSGSLHNGSMINENRTCGIKLPKLPAGFVYTTFALSDSTLYVSWEESNFINTGRAGFLQVLLANVLRKANLYESLAGN